jgi:hypothetical protein
MSSLGKESPVPQLPLLGTATGPRAERKPDIFSPKPSQQAGGVSEKANLPEKAHASQDDNEITPAPPLLGHTTTGTSPLKTVSPRNTSPSTQHGGGPSQPHARRFLNAAEWARVAHGLGAILDDKEDHRVARPTCWYWPPKGIPDGLYREVVVQRSKYGLAFVLLGAAHWALMVVQVMVGAVLTALGSLELRQNAVITILAAANTVGAGLLGLMHNSGLPDRYRMDQAQFASVEGFIRVGFCCAFLRRIHAQLALTHTGV